jgi:conjugative transfer signal peptidase TraF
MHVAASWFWQTTSVAALALIGFAWVHEGDLVLYNHSPSMTPGLYLRSERTISLGAIVTIRATEAAPLEAARRGFDGPHDRFLKRIAALPGDTICGQDADVTINGRPAATRRSVDTQGLALPTWEGCRVLAEDQLFLLGDSADSFDGRYFGPVERAYIEGVWRPLQF